MAVLRSLSGKGKAQIVVLPGQEPEGTWEKGAKGALLLLLPCASWKFDR